MELIDFKQFPGITVSQRLSHSKGDKKMVYRIKKFGCRKNLWTDKVAKVNDLQVIALSL